MYNIRCVCVQIFQVYLLFDLWSGWKENQSINVEWKEIYLVWTYNRWMAKMCLADETPFDNISIQYILLDEVIFCILYNMILALYMPMVHAPNIIIDFFLDWLIWSWPFLFLFPILKMMIGSNPFLYFYLYEGNYHFNIFLLSIMFRIFTRMIFCIIISFPFFVYTKRPFSEPFCFHLKRFIEIGFRRFSRWLSR